MKPDRFDLEAKHNALLSDSTDMSQRFVCIGTTNQMRKPERSVLVSRTDYHFAKI